ncbi:MAG: 4a-hydroxytetrahydrobiopterin dehydratase [Candidatus Peribacteraceae bacterium]|jgi:4a-hydroxytetrahydrobiopterin dehydratase|nr:4a-hydroxytetrahydrobiopterin dehydratase [bacterium]MDP6561438.1 4a-hydroxytetrahydrobiopterin dehydratase [Candidatus Peribacteraceae bacterium]|tara:strand:- start:20398 stop:20685 length:288 start_codon:yes stop_codon:yes gene_type:complete
MTTPISKEQAEQLLKDIVQWQVGDDGKLIAKTFTLEDFQSAVVFVNQVAKISDDMNHHPDIFIHNYNNVTVSLTTHSAGGLSEDDFILASKIDEL